MIVCSKWTICSVCWRSTCLSFLFSPSYSSSTTPHSHPAPFSSFANLSRIKVQKHQQTAGVKSTPNSRCVRREATLEASVERWCCETICRQFAQPGKCTSENASTSSARPRHAKHNKQTVRHVGATTTGQTTVLSWPHGGERGQGGRGTICIRVLVCPFAFSRARGEPRSVKSSHESWELWSVG